LNDAVKLEGIIGRSGEHEVLLGFAPASLLHKASFADALDEDTGRGYQRRFNAQHSLDFRRYIQEPNSSTIPLTFNARPGDGDWRVERNANSKSAELIIRGEGKVLAQVDCQHRLGYLNDLNVSLPFMCYLGLTLEQEMTVFNVINGKAKGLSTSLLDFHEATLASDLAAERPELFIALELNNAPESPWYRQLDLGGEKTSGLTRRASLRTMQKAVKRFLTQSKILAAHGPADAASVMIDFWSAVSVVLKNEWDNPRRHLVSKGVGVYALTATAADICRTSAGGLPDKKYFIAALADFASSLDWSNEGVFKGLGGEGGVKTAIALLQQARTKSALRIVTNG
jgi:DNA sulfur modification protein DndB